MSKRVFKILSIDGGGILGLYSADVLKNIQTDFLKGKTFSEEFHLITGTSTGGIIAAALALGREPSKIIDFYTEFGERIFPSWRRKLPFAGIIREKYSNRVLKQALNEFFGESTIADCKTALCIPAIDISNCHPVIFKTNNSGDQTRDSGLRLQDIALATSAAPTYFPIYSFERFTGLVDGGLWQNNPALCGIIEALNYFIGKDDGYDTIHLLSIGNPLSGVRTSIPSRNKHSSLLKWRQHLVHIPMKVSTLGTHYIINLLVKSPAIPLDRYLRIESENLTDEYKDLALDTADKRSYEKILARSQFDYNQNKQKITQFFEEEKDGRHAQGVS
jgi:hypothetical protein